MGQCGEGMFSLGGGECLQKQEKTDTKGSRAFFGVERTTRSPVKRTEEKKKPHSASVKGPPQRKRLTQRAKLRIKRGN